MTQALNHFKFHFKFKTEQGSTKLTALWLHGIVSLSMSNLEAFLPRLNLLDIKCHHSVLLDTCVPLKHSSPVHTWMAKNVTANRQILIGSLSSRSWRFVLFFCFCFFQKYWNYSKLYQEEEGRGHNVTSHQHLWPGSSHTCPFHNITSTMFYRWCAMLLIMSRFSPPPYFS